jgi:hypothetical protein
MKRTFQLLLAVAAAGTIACSRTPAERKLILDATDAMGGRDRILAVKTLTIDGEGDAPNVGPNKMPGR